MADTISRKNIIITVFIICAVFLIGKAAQLQVIDSSYQERARKTTLTKKTLYPSRGMIYDRNKELLVINYPTYDIKVIYNQVDPKMDTTLFCQLLQIDEPSFVQNLNKDWRSVLYSKSIPFTFLSNLSSEQYASFQEHLFKFPGFYSELRNVRGYPHTNAAHVLGYISEVDQKVISNSEGVYSLGDYIGISGIEKIYEDQLRGEKGVEYFLKDNIGREVDGPDYEAFDMDPKEGADLITTLDLELQKFGEILLQNKSGSVVAIEPSTGEILSMISSKTYDPNLLTINKNRGKSFFELFNDSINKPFLDRSVTAKYPPGSIFKPILSLIALQEGTTYANRTIYCDGSYTLNKKKGFSQGCHDHPIPYNIKSAIQYSCNSYYYQLMRELIEKYGYSNPGDGLEAINRYLYRFGMGNKLGTDITNESSGFIPTSSYFDKLYKDVRSGWRSTYILSLGIGQGEMQLTTLQMANLAAIIANRGHYYTPHLIKNFSKEEFRINENYTQKRTVGIDQQHFEPVIDGMERVITAGTGVQAYVRGIEVCGKTGTSQNAGIDHSVFFAFAPKEDPKIAIAVFIENAGWGGDIAASVAGLMIEKYLNSEIGKNNEWKVEFIQNRSI